MPPKASGKKDEKKDGKKPAPAKSAAANPKVNVDCAQALWGEIQAERAQKDRKCASEMAPQAVKNIAKNTGADEAESSKPNDKLGDKPGEDEAAPSKPAGNKVTPEEKRKRHLEGRAWGKWMGLYQEDSDGEDGFYDHDSDVNPIPEETKKWGKKNGGKKKKLIVIESEGESESCYSESYSESYSDEDDTEDDEAVDTGKVKGKGKGEGKESAKAKKPGKRTSPDSDYETDKGGSPLPKKPKTAAKPAFVAKPKATSKSTAGGSKAAKGKTNKNDNPGDEPGEDESPAAEGRERMATPASAPADDPAREGKCKAIVVTTEKPCLNKAKPSSEYCGVHKSQDPASASPPNRATKGKGYKK